MNLSAQQKVYLIIGIIFLIFGLIIFLVIRPLILKIKEIGLEFKETQKQVSLLQQKGNYADDLEDHYLGFEKQLEKIDEIFVKASTESILDFFTLSGDISKKMQVNVDVGKVEEKNEMPLKLSSTLTINGSLTNTSRFLTALENLPHFLEIKQLEMKFSETANNLTTRAVIVIYAQK